MAEPIELVIQEYARRYMTYDPDAVAELCHCPYLAVRAGAAIHFLDHAALRDHFGSRMGEYQAGRLVVWSPITSDVRKLGEHAAFVTVRWNALNDDQECVRDTLCTYHLLLEAGEWRFTSYTDHYVK